MFNRKKKEIEQLRQRVTELEKLICPNDKHDWKLERKEDSGGFLWYICRCTRCNKEYKTLFPVD